MTPVGAEVAGPAAYTADESSTISKIESRMLSAGFYQVGFEGLAYKIRFRLLLQKRALLQFLPKSARYPHGDALGSHVLPVSDIVSFLYDNNNFRQQAILTFANGDTAMPLTSDTKKVMFEIYRDADYGNRYRVVYFTELGEHDKEDEINNAMRGQHVFDGFLLHRERNAAKQVVDEILKRLNQGEQIDEAAIRQTLQPYLA
jgi:hypothetical protein